MVEQLFGSKTRVKLLQLFYSNPNRAFYVREITRKVDEQINSVRRELANLLSIGIIVSDTTDNRLYYEVNQQYEYYAALSVMFGGAAAKKVGSARSTAVKRKTTLSPEATEIAALGNVEIAIYTGQFTRDASSGVDLVIVGDINQTKLQKFITDLEAREGKELRYVVMTLAQFEYRRQINDRFIATVLQSKKHTVIDRHDVLV